MIAKLNCNLLEKFGIGWYRSYSQVYARLKLIAQAISLKKFCSHRLIHKNREPFPALTIHNIRMISVPFFNSEITAVSK